jgi:hypothetical protein
VLPTPSLILMDAPEWVLLNQWSYYFMFGKLPYSNIGFTASERLTPAEVEDIMSGKRVSNNTTPLCSSSFHFKMASQHFAYHVSETLDRTKE